MKISTHIVMFLALIVMHNAGAIQVVGEQDTAATASSRAANNEREGAIDIVDLGGRLMIVDGARYFFSATTTSVHGASPLALKKNDRIRFKVQNESGMERINEIWLLSAPQH